MTSKEIQEGDDEGLDEHFVGVMESLPSVGNELADDSVVFSSASFGGVFSEVKHKASDSDEGSAGGFVSAVFGELLCLVGLDFRQKSVSKTLFIMYRNRRQMNETVRNLLLYKDLQRRVKKLI